MSVSQIVIAPHPALRQKAQPILELNSDILDYLDSVTQTVAAQTEPAAAGLALPQINRNFRAFTTYLENSKSDQPQVRLFINPEVTDSADKQVTGINERQPDLEGCLSIPWLYGPVKRPEWVTFRFQLLQPDKTLSDYQQETFTDFAARVMLHELDHLNGVLFTDHVLQQSQPLYRSEKSKLIEVDPIIAEAF